ncbi:MAG: hypothetical protein JW996_05790, partial [Candidatus Cloacimonetes bacterium]|nr:hypothetical protein [Candidatus Cloacimonadota bacterium]
MIKKLMTIFLIGSIIMTITAQESGYKLPPEDIIEIYNIQPDPYLKLIEFQSLALEINYKSEIELADLAEPLLKLAGTKISPRLNGSPVRYHETSYSVIDFRNNLKLEISLPSGIRIRNQSLSPAQNKLAASYELENGISLLIINLIDGEVKFFSSIRLNEAFDSNGFQWLDETRLLLNTIKQDRGTQPQRSPVPESPVMEETSGKFSTNRTYQDLLKNKHDELLFEYFFTGQIAVLDLGSDHLENIGNPGIYYDIKPSPDCNYLLIEQIIPPYSYELPYYRFPQKIQLWDITGSIVKEFYSRPLQDQIPIGGTYQGPRHLQWQPLKNAALVWLEALDQGDPKIDVPERDQVMRQQAPFKEQPEELYRTRYRHQSLTWSEREDELIYAEYDRDRLWSRTWLLDLNNGEQILLFDLSVNDNYHDPGRIITRQTGKGEKVFLKKDDKIYFNNPYGATPEGNYPYLSAFDLTTCETQILYRSQPQQFERILGFLNDDLDQILISSENTEIPRNYFVLDLNSQNKKKITDHKNPYPESAELIKELITYNRKDGVPLSGTLYLPSTYKPGDKLPLVLHAYPEEFTDSSTAGQIKTSPYSFNRYHGASIRYFAQQGYAVLLNASIPIVGDPETVNENFIEQLINSIEAAIDHLD